MERTPLAVGLYRGYCVLAAVANGAIGMGAFWATHNLDFFGEDVAALPQPQLLGYLGGVALAGCLTMVVLEIVALLLPRTEWAWHVHLSNLIAGIVLCVLLPFAAPLIPMWLKPEVRRHFADDRPMDSAGKT